MIIGVTGATKVGKSTFIKDFIKTYSKYGQPAKTYRDIPDLDLYEKGTMESQGKIRDFMFKQAKDIWHMRDTDKRVIQDRTLLDNLAVTLYLYGTGVSDITDEFIVESFAKTKQAMSFYHMIYFIPVSANDKIPVPDDIDEDFRGGFDIILKTFWNAYKNRDPMANDIFPEKNCTAVEEIFGSPKERVIFAGELLDENGDLMGGMGNAQAPQLYGADGRDISMGKVNSEFTLRDFGFGDKDGVV